MTRIARPAGVNKSEQRVPFDATPWTELVSDVNQGVNVGSVCGVDEECDLRGRDSSADNPELTSMTDAERAAAKKAKQKEKARAKCLNCKTVGHQKRFCPELTEERREELQDLYDAKVRARNRRLGLEPENAEPRPDKGRCDKKVPRKDKLKKIRLSQTEISSFKGRKYLTADVKALKSLDANLRQASKPDRERRLRIARRQAERRLGRYKQRLCFICRKPGHVVSECPRVDDSVGICYKCGSNSHTVRECSNQLQGVDGEQDSFSFAKCFICAKTGHLARQCPDNPRGLYPDGGGCRLCGSVEHLRAQCPVHLKKVANSQVTVDRIDDKSIEVEAVTANRNNDCPTAQKKRMAVVRF